MSRILLENFGGKLYSLRNAAFGIKGPFSGMGRTKFRGMAARSDVASSMLLVHVGLKTVCGCCRFAVNVLADAEDSIVLSCTYLPLNRCYCGCIGSYGVQDLRTS